MRQYIVDAFTDRLFSGNPAAVCVMENWPSEKLMMNIAMENNLSETAFIVKESGVYHLRWFTPGGEIDFCGHATLASAFVIANYIEPGTEKITFKTMHGELVIDKVNDVYRMNFPVYKLKEVPVTDLMLEACGGLRPVKAMMARDLVLIFEDEEIVRTMKPDHEKVKLLDGLLLHVTAPGKNFDCVSRSFAPKLNVSEDPVCGSGHCHIAPYWTERLGKQDIIAYQASRRGGTIYCHQTGEKIVLSGKAVLFAISDVCKLL